MSKQIQTNIDEINIIDLVQIIWTGKWKIVLITVVIAISIFNYQAKDTKKFTATTDIEPITTYEESKFDALNYIKNININNSMSQKDEDMNISYTPLSLGYPQVTRENLLIDYVEILNEKSLFKDALDKFKYLDINNYSNEQDYNEALNLLSSSIKIIIEPQPITKNDIEFTVSIKFSHSNNDKKKWKNLLQYVDKLASEVVKQNIKNQYKRLLLIEKKKVNHQVEDLSLQIDNLRSDYDRRIADRVLYLKEQSQIAQKLGIAKNTIEVQTFGNQNALLSNVKTDSPFYLRGYEAIDKEIELMTSRTDKSAFIDGLYELEIEKRSLQQDKSLERAELLISTTPIGDSGVFFAALANISSTKFTYNNNKKIQIFAILIGLIIGVFYVFVTHAIHSQVIAKKK